MAKSITEQIEQLQAENNRLREFEKLFEKALKKEFGIGKKEIEKKISAIEKPSNFENQLCDYFGLISEHDKSDFLSIMCSESSLKFFLGKRDKINQQG